jgi:hypothetical protein
MRAERMKRRVGMRGCDWLKSDLYVMRLPWYSKEDLYMVIA